jgi:preprotein translocase subunit YajC
MEMTAMVFLLGALVVLMLGGFFVAWRRDKSRSQEQAQDPERLDTDSTGPAGPTGPARLRHDGR